MEELLSLFGLPNLPAVFKNRIIFSMICLLISSILFYFWLISRKKIKASQKDGSGLVYLTFTSLLCALMSIVSAYYQVYDIKNPSTYLILSGLISICFLSSLSFFSLGTHPIDKWVMRPSWKNGLKYMGFAWVIMISMISHFSFVHHLDMILSVLSLAALGFFITRYFIQRQLNYIALLSAGNFIVIILLNLQPENILPGNRFDHITTIFLAPCIAISVITLAYTFNWINELNFYELSNIWLGTENPSQQESAAYSKLTVDANQDAWMERIASDDIEKVIQEVIILKKHRNENLETILNIAARNTRNNNNHLKDLIRYEDYQLNRNKVANSLMGIIKN